MDLSSWKRDLNRIIKLSKKPSRKEFWISVRISALGMLIIGIVAFVIKLIFTLVVGFTPPTA